MVFKLDDFKSFQLSEEEAASLPALDLDGEIKEIDPTTLSISKKMLKLITTGQGDYPSRSECDMAGMVALVAGGCTDLEVASVFNHYAIGEKSRENKNGYFEYTLKKAKAWVAKNKEEEPPAPDIPGTSTLMPTSVEDVKAVIEKTFPGTWDATEACGAVICQRYVSDITQPFNLNLIGNPSGSKTLVLSYFYGIGDDLVCRSDGFTAHCFVSHSPKKTTKELEKVDLLPRIKNKCLITPEMNSIFSAEGDKLNEILGIITRIIDGEGFQSDSGSHGRRGYSEPVFFTWLGATTPPRRAVWNLMSRYGSKMYFYSIPKNKNTAEEYLDATIAGRPTQEKLREVRNVMNPLMRSFKPVAWDKTKEPRELYEKIHDYASLLACLRTSFTIWADDDDYDTSSVVKEDLYRVIGLLYNLARGRAVLYGRNYITEDDLPMVLHVGMSGAEISRTELLRLLIDEEELTTTMIEEKMQVSSPTARKHIQSLKVMGLADVDAIGKSHITSCTLKEEFAWLKSSLKGKLR